MSTVVSRTGMTLTSLESWQLRSWDVQSNRNISGGPTVVLAGTVRPLGLKSRERTPGPDRRDDNLRPPHVPHPSSGRRH